MASRQLGAKHGFVSKIVGCCSSYVVIAPCLDLTWSTFLPKVAQGFVSQGTPKPGGMSVKNLRGGGLYQPSCPGED